MRPAVLNPLFAEATSLKGVGPAVARGLRRLGIERIVDLAFHLPVSAIERERLDRLVGAWVDRFVTIEVTVVAHDPGAGRAPTRIRCEDAEGTPLSLVFFADRGGYARQQLPVGERRVVSGRLEQYGQNLQIVHPDFVLPSGRAGEVPEVEPVYALTEGIANKRMRALAGAALARAPDLPEWIEPSVAAREAWPGWREALAAAHAMAGGEGVRDRLAYDELLANQLALLLVRQSVRRRPGRPLAGDGRLVDALLAKLPYTLTGAQRRTVEEIRGDLAQSAPMLRLLQGDVGSGKTVVALLALLMAVEAGAQGALLAPTEILARQHQATLAGLLDGLPVRLGFLSGREKGRGRAETLEALVDGSVDILVGTHAIFQDRVAYRDLGLVVIDEQHRFGVHQRMELTEKAERPAHLLVMTATPIPRTLTLANFGEMDVSRLDERPPGRQPIETRVVSLERLGEVVGGLARHLDRGGQAYWVCPLVEESEKGDLAAAEARAAELRLAFGDKVGLVHGRMKGPDKDAAMAAFKEARTGLLVSTTVIEVGVDVPNATLMIIEQAERFGLAQLHQLRGRVGRGSGRSVCLLLRSPQVSETAKARLSLMRETTDGFRIAEEDLRLRGGGEILGTRQSGEAAFRLATPEQVGRWLDTAHDDARLLLDRDGGLDAPRGQAARTLLYLFERDSAAALLRSG